MEWAEAFSAIRDALSGLSGGTTLAAMLALVAVATVSMAVLQLLKELTPVRRWFQQAWIERWMCRRRAAFCNAPREGEPTVVSPASVCVELAQIAAGGEKEAFYDMPIEQLILEANAAGQIALDQPSDYWTLLGVLSEGASRDDLHLLLRGHTREGAQQFFDARARVNRRIERNLQGIKIACGNRWRWILLWASIVITSLITVATVGTQTSDTRLLWLAAAVGVVASYLAPIARDLLAAVQQLRRP